MNAAVYLFQVSACMGIFYLFYYLLLSRYTFFTLNRWYLIITLALCFIIPLLTITVQQQESYPQVIKQVVYINQMQTPQQVVVADQAPTHMQINWMALVKVIYTVAVAALLIRLLLLVVKFFTRVKDKQRTTIGGVHIVQGDEQINNGSFFNFIFLNGDELSADELNQIIAHEMLHVKLFHSVDRMLVKMAQVFLWFNPFVYLYARAIEENHEFEVDRAVSNSTDRNKYAELLFHLSIARQGTLYHNFSMVPLKKRITMLFTKPTNRMKKIIYLLVVPVVLISCLAFAKLKNEAPGKVKKATASVFADSNAVRYRQKSKLTPAQRKKQDEGMKKMQAYFESGEGLKKAQAASALTGKTMTFEVEENEIALHPNPITDDIEAGIKLKGSGGSYSMVPVKGLNNLKRGDVVTINIRATGYNVSSPLINIMPEWVAKDGVKIFEAEKLPHYPFGYEANKVRFSYGKFSKIEKYANGKWKTAVYESAGYKFNLTFKPNAPDLNRIKLGDDITLRFIHEVKTGEKTYKINDWVAISKDIKDYGIKNPEWFYKFYEVVKADTGKVSAIGGIDGLGANPLVLINGKEYPKEILYQISGRGIRGSSMYPPNNGTTKYGDKAKDGAIVIETRDGEINYLTNTEKENLLKLQAAKGKFFSRVTLIKEDGSKYDMATLSRASGSRASADLATNGKIAFIINGEVYNEAQFKRLFKTDKASYGPSIGVGGASKELKDKGFKLDGYDLVFEFNPGANSKVTGTSVKTGAVTPDKKATGTVGFSKGITLGKISRSLSYSSVAPQYGFWSLGTQMGIGRSVVISGGQSDFRGKITNTFGSTIKGSRDQPAERSADDAVKPNKETVPEGKDSVGNTKRALDEAMANLPEFEVRADGTAWFKGKPANRVMVDGKEFIPAKVAEKVKVTNTPKILVDGKEFIPNNIDIKKDPLNSVPKARADFKTLNDSLVAARFSGKVTTVKEIFDTKLVIIKNGEYFAAYANLKNVNVSAGQEIKLGQVIGAAAFNPDENKVAAQVELYRGSTMITNKEEQEVIIRDLGQQRLNMRLKLGEVYAFNH